MTVVHLTDSDEILDVFRQTETFDIRSMAIWKWYQVT
jgi:hypothetical protein